MSAEQSYREDTGAGPDTSRYLDYLKTNRDFTVSAVAAAVASIELAESDRPVRAAHCPNSPNWSAPQAVQQRAR